jgi:glycosyltransferase involved in cell wall biosynthesis
MSENGPVTVALITPTINRPTLRRAIESARGQLEPGDEWFVVGDGPQPEVKALVDSLADPRIRYREHYDPRSTYGNAQRNVAMSEATADFFLFLDDDDCLLPGALRAVRREGVHGVPLMFRMNHGQRGCILWEERVIREANVGGAMFVVPNRKGRWAKWPETGRPAVSDFAFITATLALWPPGSLRWCEDVITFCRQHGGGR